MPYEASWKRSVVFGSGFGLLFSGSLLFYPEIDWKDLLVAGVVTTGMLIPAIYATEKYFLIPMNRYAINKIRRSREKDSLTTLGIYKKD